MYVGLEGAATEIRNFELAVVPGLLQTEDYARAISTAAFPEQPEERGSGSAPRQVAQEHAQ